MLREVIYLEHRVFYLVVIDSIFLHTFSVEAAIICGVHVIFDPRSMKNLSTGVKELDKIQHKISGICRRLYVMYKHI